MTGRMFMSVSWGIGCAIAIRSSGGCLGMRVTVCEMPDETPAFERAWRALVDHCRGRETDLVLLPELPFYPWFGTTPTFDSETWRAAEEAHRTWVDRLHELAPAAVLARWHGSTARQEPTS
jgi:predicted amidohydrolase